MQIPDRFKNQLNISPNFAVWLVSVLVALYGVYTLAETLFEQLFLHHHGMFNRTIIDFNLDLSLLLGVSVIYLSFLLKRRKRRAWIVTILAYVFYIGVNVSQLINDNLSGHRHGTLPFVLRAFVFPIILLGLLYIFRKEYVVKSDVARFRTSLRFIVVILGITIIYGVVGFMSFDESDFHQEINFSSAIHYTVDQVNLTTSEPLHPYTKRATLFVDSLSFVSTVSVIYAVFSLFQPLKFRFYDQSHSRETVLNLMRKYKTDSEEFFKLWPHDKQYYFDDTRQSALAYHVFGGVALVVSDPIGDEKKFDDLLTSFLQLCFYNDWLPSFIHVSNKYYELYEKNGFTVQKLGQEAIVDINNFEENLKRAKYFRQITNKFNRQDYSYELLSPPHHEAVMERLRSISEEWLSKGGRDERGFVLGYYTDEYIQQCKIAVARDAAGTIQGFLNVVPADFDSEEATYDMIRQSDKAPGNIVDFLLINLISSLKEDGYQRFNMGLCPLAGLDEEDNSDKKTVLDTFLRLVYANGDTFFSFSGLYRFKSKYEPYWQDKYVVYKGGIPGFTKTMTALTRFMTKSVNLK